MQKEGPSRNPGRLKILISYEKPLGLQYNKKGARIKIQRRDDSYKSHPKYPVEVTGKKLKVSIQVRILC